MAKQSIRQAICRIVRQYPEAGGRVIIEPPPTQETIARCVGTTPEQVGHVMPEFIKSGLIETSRKRWIVHDVAGVCRLAPEL